MQIFCPRKLSVNRGALVDGGRNAGRGIGSVFIAPVTKPRRKANGKHYARDDRSSYCLI
jgi:hypothetical protein